MSIRKTLVLAIILLSALARTAHASDVPTNSYDLYYAASNGSRLDPAQAILAALKGGQVYKCQSVEAKVSKSGTSIGIKAVKKPKNTKVTASN